MRRVLVCAFAVAATVTPSTHHVERVTLVFAQAEGATKGPEGDWGLGAQLTALEAVVQRAATPDPAAVSARSSLQESTLREPLDDDPQRTPASLASDHLALVVEGATAMETILGNEELEQRFLKLANVCKAVVACRVSPAQKQLIVGLVRRKDTTRPVTLAIGDGANDVGMIQEAHIGVGISGKEGRQAVNNSDFAIGQFRFLKPLLLKHGRRNYRRMSKVIVYSFFKNIVLTFVLFYYQADCGWSGTSFYEAWVYSGFNFFLAFTPLAFGWFDVDTSAETVRKYPRLYAAGLHRMDLNVTNMASRDGASPYLAVRSMAATSRRGGVCGSSARASRQLSATPPPQTSASRACWSRRGLRAIDAVGASPHRLRSWHDALTLRRPQTVWPHRGLEHGDEEAFARRFHAGQRHAPPSRSVSRLVEQVPRVLLSYAVPGPLRVRHLHVRGLAYQKCGLVLGL